MKEKITIEKAVYENMQSTFRAWQAVFDALLAGNPQTFQSADTGIVCAVREIKRLQALAAETTKQHAVLNDFDKASRAYLEPLG